MLVQLLSSGHVPHTLSQKCTELKCIHFSVWPSAQNQLQNFVQQSQEIQTASQHSWYGLEDGTSGDHKTISSGTGIFKSVVLYWVDLSKLVLKPVTQWCSANSFYTWWETVLNILGGPHCSGTALCHVGNTALFNAGGKVSDGCWWDVLWMCLLHFRNKKSHWLQWQF